MRLFKKYLPEILIFGVIFTILMVDLSPSYTFFNKAADSIGYTYSAKYLYPAHHTSAPLYLLLGHTFLQLPFGTEAWRFSLLSVVATMLCCLFVYLIISKLVKSKNVRLYALLGTFLFGTSALVISQSTITETYPLVTMSAAGAYYFSLDKRWKLVAICLGVGLAIHLLGFLIAAVFFFGYKGYRKNWKALFITACFVLFYLYIPLTAKNSPTMWLPKDSNSILSTIGTVYSVITQLVGTISIWDTPKRIIDTIGLVGVSVGVVTVIPIVYYVTKKKIYKSVLFWLVAVPITLFISELDMNTFDYIMPAIPFLIIIACLGLEQLVVKKYGKVLMITTVVCAVVIAGFNANYFDLGRTLDKKMTATHLYEVEFDKIPDGAIFMPNWGWEWEAVYKYNKDNHRHIYQISKDALNSGTYLDGLRKDGVKLEYDATSDNLSVRATMTARSIIALNDNVWTTVTTDSHTFDSYVVEANHNVELIPKLDDGIIKANAEHPTWKWKPYNPYDIMTTILFEKEWSYVIVSNKNLILIVGVFAGGYLLYMLPSKLFSRKKEKKETAM